MYESLLSLTIHVPKLRCEISVPVHVPYMTSVQPAPASYYESARPPRAGLDAACTVSAKHSRYGSTDPAAGAFRESIDACD
jgi:hypothetical protein